MQKEKEKEKNRRYISFFCSDYLVHSQPLAQIDRYPTSNEHPIPQEKPTTSTLT